MLVFLDRRSRGTYTPEGRSARPEQPAEGVAMRARFAGLDTTLGRIMVVVLLLFILFMKFCG